MCFRIILRKPGGKGVGEGHEITHNRLLYSFFFSHLGAQPTDVKRHIKHWKGRSLETSLMAGQLLSGKDPS